MVIMLAYELDNIKIDRVDQQCDFTLGLNQWSVDILVYYSRVGSLAILFGNP